jgi:hypothetical protein
MSNESQHRQSDLTLVEMIVFLGALVGMGFLIAYGVQRVNFVKHFQNLRKAGVRFSFLDGGGVNLLDVSHSWITADEMDNAAYIGPMVGFNAAHSKFEDRGFEFLKDQDQIQTLHLAASCISNEGLKSVARCKNLRVLDLRATFVTDEGLKHLLPLTQLVELKISQSAITDKGLKTIAKMKQLETLELHHTVITDNGLKALYDHPNLYRVTVSKGLVTAQGAGRLKRHIQSVRMIGESQFEVRAPIFATGVTAGPKTTNWSTADQQQHFVEYPVKKLIEASGGVVQDRNSEGYITTVHLQEGNFADSDMPQLGKLRFADRMMLDGNAITDAGIKHLRSCRVLSELSLRDVDLTNEGLKTIGTFTGLRTLDLTGTSITAEGIEHLSKLPRLSTLRMNNIPFDETLAKHIGKCKHLRQIELYNSDITAKALHLVRVACKQHPRIYYGKRAW